MRIDRRQCSFRSVAYIRLHNGTRQSTARVRTPRTRNENQQDEYATRCAPSFNEQHKRKRSHVILNEGPSSLPVPSCSLFLPSSLVHLLVVSIFFRLLLPYSFPRQLVGSNLCLSLSLLVWFVGSRLGTVITGYPALTSVTLVVLSPRTTRGTMRSILGRSKEDPTSRLLASPLLLPPFVSNLLLLSLSLFSFAPRSTPSYPPYLLLSLFPSLFPSPVSVLYVAPAVYLLDSLFHSSRSILLFYLHCISPGFIILVIRALTSPLSSTVEPVRPFPRSLPCPCFLPLGLLTPPISTSFLSLL